MIIERTKIELSETQKKLLSSGWGKDVLLNTTLEKITYESEGLKVKGYIAYPKDTSKKYPCIIWNRGGFRNQGVIDAFTAYGIYGQIASWGYVVFATQYRGNDGGEGIDEIGGNEVNDIINLIPLAEEIECADKDSWGIEGWSRGGMMTFKTLMANKLFKCAVLVCPLTDFNDYLNQKPNRKSFYKEIFQDNFTIEIEKRSIINNISHLPHVPYLIMHGGADETIPVQQSINLTKELTNQNHKFRFVLLEDGDHFLKNHRKEVLRLRKLWFNKYLKAHEISS